MERVMQRHDNLVFASGGCVATAPASNSILKPGNSKGGLSDEQAIDRAINNGALDPDDWWDPSNADDYSAGCGPLDAGDPCGPCDPFEEGWDIDF